jgi:hypothetical protein
MKKEQGLPPNIVESDLKMEYNNRIPCESRPEWLPHYLTFHLVKTARTAAPEVIPELSGFWLLF